MFCTLGAFAASHEAAVAAAPLEMVVVVLVEIGMVLVWAGLLGPQ
jgi:hypothetical protein